MTIASVILVLVVSLSVGIIVSLLTNKKNKGSHKLPIILSFVSVGIASYFLYLTINTTSKIEKRENENLVDRYYLDMTNSLLNNDEISSDTKRYIFFSQIANIIDNMNTHNDLYLINNKEPNKYISMISKLSDIQGFREFWDQNKSQYNASTNLLLSKLWKV